MIPPPFPCRPLILGVVLPGLLSLGACANPSVPGTTPDGASVTTGEAAGSAVATPAPITLMLDYQPNTNHTGIYVAQAHGYFQAAGLAVTIIEPGEVYPEQALTTGVADFGISFQEALDAVRFMKLAREKCAAVDLKPDFLKRGVNEGFSGGEKKRNELLQMMLLEPSLAILDETDSGLDIDALQVVANGVNSLRSPARSFVIVTHYQRLLDYIVPDFVHVLAHGRIVKSGGKELALELEEKGYAWIEKEVA